METFSHYYQDLYNYENEKLSQEELRKVGESVNLDIDDSSTQQIERLTKEQSGSTFWMHFRSGRITASTFKLVCRTSIDNPALSIVKKICYPADCAFHSKATSYGCRHEDMAYMQYTSRMEKDHINFKLSKSGFHVNNKCTGFGASPDGMAYCDCHKMSILC